MLYVEGLPVAMRKRVLAALREYDTHTEPHVTVWSTACVVLSGTFDADELRRLADVLDELRVAE